MGMPTMQMSVKQVIVVAVAGISVAHVVAGASYFIAGVLIGVAIAVCICRMVQLVEVAAQSFDRAVKIFQKHDKPVENYL